MAPPASAMLAGASAVAGTLSSWVFTNIFNLNFFLPFVVLVDPSMEKSYQITRCLLGKISFSRYLV